MATQQEELVGCGDHIAYRSHCALCHASNVPVGSGAPYRRGYSERATDVVSSFGGLETHADAVAELRSLVVNPRIDRVWLRDSSDAVVWESR